MKKQGSSKKEEFGGLVFKVGPYVVRCDKYQFILNFNGSKINDYFPTIGACFDYIYELECKNNFLKNEDKENIVAIQKCIKDAEEYIGRILEPLLDTSKYKNLKNKWPAETKVDEI